MAIKREDIDSRQVDFSDVRSGRRLPPVHPGEILRDEFLTPMDISVYELANALQAPRSRVNDIVRGAARDHHRHGAAPRAILRHVAGVLDQPAGPL